MTKKYQLDALHAHWVLPNAPIAALIAHRYRLPLIISLHGSDIFVAKNNPILKRIARWAFSKAIAISACSPDLVEGALEIGASPERIHLIPWGADPNVFKQNSRAEGLRTRWKIPHRKKVVLSLGRLVKKKGIEYLVGAMPHILPTCPDTQFVIVGDGPELDRLKKLATDLKVSEQVVFTGSLPWDEVPAAFQLCDIFVVPSIYDEQGNVDGLPTTILEAMAAGKPVVASNVAGIPLVVAHQKTGLLTKEADVFQLSEALIDLLNSDKRRLAFGWEGRKRVDRQLNWREVAKKFEQFLKT